MKWAQTIRLIAQLMQVVRRGPKRPGENGQPILRYKGSSTIANFIRDTRIAYAETRFLIDMEPESAGGELAILEERADLAGVARPPAAATLTKGLAATMLGYDAIVVVVNRANRIDKLTRDQLKAIFSGATTNWKSFGGPDLHICAFIPGRDSATREIFRAAFLGNNDFGGCETMIPNPEILVKVWGYRGAIGFVSSSFLRGSKRVKTCTIDGKEPVAANSSYPIRRPVYLLWWPGQPRVEHFICWTKSPEARQVLLRHFFPPGGTDRPQDAS